MGCPSLQTTYQDPWTDTNTLLDNWVIGSMFNTPIGARPWTAKVAIVAGPARLSITAIGNSPQTTAFPLFMIPNQYDHGQVSKKNQYAQAKLTTFTGSVGSKLVGPAVLISNKNNAGGGGSFYYAATDRVNGLRLLAWNGGIYRILASGFTVVATDTVRIEVTIGGSSNDIKIFKNGAQQGSTVTDSDGTRPTTGMSGLVADITADGATDVSDWNDFNGGAL